MFEEEWRRIEEDMRGKMREMWDDGVIGEGRGNTAPSSEVG